MSDKTLVERLRYGSTANGTCTGAENGTCASVVIRNMLDKERESRYVCTTCRNCINETMNKLADAIEREYLPRPRFDDGEPVQFGDMAEVREDLGDVIEMIFQDDKCVEVGIAFDGGESTSSHYMTHDGERVKRPEPEALDSDGVPIRVGDTVYFVNDQEPLRVTKINNAWWVICEGESEDHIFTHPDEDLTHKRPDSLERIEADARKNPYDYWGCGGASCLNCPAKKDGKEPRERYGAHSCNQAMKLDILRRQREVLERER